MVNSYNLKRMYLYVLWKILSILRDGKFIGIQRLITPNPKTKNLNPLLTENVQNRMSEVIQNLYKLPTSKNTNIGMHWYTMQIALVWPITWIQSKLQICRIAAL